MSAQPRRVGDVGARSSEGDDFDLVVAAKAGDTEAWRALYRAHAGRLVAWLSLRPSGDAAAAAEDIAHEAWLVAASRIADFEGTADDFAGWLFGIARKSSASTRRRSDRRRTHPGEVGEHLPTVADPTVARDDEDWVRAAIAGLPPRERDVVGLTDGLGFDTPSTAEALGISPAAVRVARHRGLRRLRRHALPAPHDAAPDTPPDAVLDAPSSVR